MPPEFKSALKANYAGQHFGEKHLFLLRRFFEAKVIFKPKSFFERAPTLKKNLSTKLVCKFDDSIKYEHGFNHINPGKFYKRIFDSRVVPDEEKLVLAKKSSTREGAVWLGKYEAKVELARQSNSQTAALDAAELHLDAQNLSGAAEQDRQAVLQQRLNVDSMKRSEADAITWYLVIFFFVARIPFRVIESWAFKAFIHAIRPSYLAFLPGRTALSTTHLKKAYEDTKDRVSAALAAVPGSKTVVVDGFKDRCNRHVMNFAVCKRGVSTYFATKYFGTRSHAGTVYVTAVKEVVGDGKEYRAVVADNTGSMKDVMLPQLGACFPFWFLLGCVPHVLDLLIEDIAKISEIHTVVTTFHGIIMFIKRFSMLEEAFLERKTVKMGFKLFSITRFAYAYLLVYSVLLHLPILYCVGEWAEYTLVKTKITKKTKVDKRGEKRAEFGDFETACSSVELKKKAKAVVAVLKPLSSTLHYLEGNSVPPSHVLPLFCSWVFFTGNLP